MSESYNETSAKKKVEALGGEFIKIRRKGIPDRILVIPGGQSYFVEMKAEKGKLDPTQRYWKRRLERKNIPHRVCKHWGEVVELYKKETGI